MKVTSTTSLCTQLPGSCHAWDVSARLGLHTGSGKGEPEDNSAGAGGGEDSETQRLGCWKIREQGGCRPRENREERTGRLGHRVLPGKQFLHASRHQTRLSVRRADPCALGESCARPRVLLTARPRALRAGGADAGRVQGGGGTSAPGPPPLGTNTASRLLGSTRLPPAQVPLGRLLSIPGLTSAPNGPQLFLRHW